MPIFIVETVFARAFGSLLARAEVAETMISENFAVFFSDGFGVDFIADAGFAAVFAVVFSIEAAFALGLTIEVVFAFGLTAEVIFALDFTVEIGFAVVIFCFAAGLEFALFSFELAAVLVVEVDLFFSGKDFGLGVFLDLSEVFAAVFGIAAGNFVRDLAGGFVDLADAFLSFGVGADLAEIFV